MTKGFRKFFTVLFVPLDPVAEVLLGGKMIGFPAVASGVRQYEIVAQIVGVTSPGDEMVHVGFSGDLLLAVEAPRPVRTEQSVAVGVQVRPLAAEEHLCHWVERNQQHGEELSEAFRRASLAHDGAASTRIAHWAYGELEQVRGEVWVLAKETRRLSGRWRACFQ